MMSEEDNELWCLVFFGTLMAANFVLSVAFMKPYPAFFSLVGIGMTAIPWALRRRRLLTLPWSLTAITGLVNILHVSGILLHMYDLVWWWDIMTHMLASMVIAAVIVIGLLLVEDHYSFLRLPPRAFPALVVGTVVFAGVIWEVLEFSFDMILNMTMQYSLDDSATDLSFDILGGAVVALMAPFYLPKLREGLENGRWAQRA